MFACHSASPERAIRGDQSAQNSTRPSETARILMRLLQELPGLSVRNKATFTAVMSGFFRLRLPQTDVKFTQLALVHRAWRVREQALGPLRLGKRDHVANRFRARHQSHDAVEPEGDTAVRRRAVLQRVQQEAE